MEASEKCRWPDCHGRAPCVCTNPPTCPSCGRPRAQDFPTRCDHGGELCWDRGDVDCTRVRRELGWPRFRDEEPALPTRCEVCDSITGCNEDRWCSSECQERGQAGFRRVGERTTLRQLGALVVRSLFVGVTQAVFVYMSERGRNTLPSTSDNDEL